MNIETICKVINEHPELQALYDERQNYPFFANTIDNLISNKFVDEEHLTYYLLWCIANLSVDTSFDTVEKLKTFIANKKPIYKYVKAESSDIEITDTTLISQLEALKTAMSYAEQTNISQINDDIPFYLDVKALTR